MGWRTDQAYEDAREESYRAWLASLPPGRRIRVRLGQGFRLALVLALPIAFLIGFCLRG